MSKFKLACLQLALRGDKLSSLAHARAMIDKVMVKRRRNLHGGTEVTVLCSDREFTEEELESVALLFQAVKEGGAQLVCLSECFAIPYGPQYFR